MIWRRFSLGRAIIETMWHFGWTEFAVMYNDDGSIRECKYVADGIEDTLRRRRRNERIINRSLKLPWLEDEYGCDTGLMVNL